MNDNDLERRLRSQRGPREEGYSPTRLPMTLEQEGARSRGPSRLTRLAVLVPVALAGALAVAVVGGMLNGSNPGPGSGSSSPSAGASSAVAGDGGCSPGDVVLAAEPWGAAAGSRGTVVTVSLAAGGNACHLPAAAGGQITDASGSVLVTQEAPVASDTVNLDEGTSYTVGVAWSNWCDPQPQGPLTLSFTIAGWADPAPVTVADGGANPVPPCLGSVPTALSLTDLQPAP